MIQTTLSNLIILYLLLGLAMICFIWLVGDWRRRRRERKLREYQFICNICGVSFEDDSKEPVVPCPQCASLNERKSLREI